VKSDKHTISTRLGHLLNVRTHSQITNVLKLTDTALQSVKRITGSSVRERSCCSWSQDWEGKRPEKTAGQGSCSTLTSDSQDDMGQDFILQAVLCVKYGKYWPTSEPQALQVVVKHSECLEQKGFICAL